MLWFVKVWINKYKGSVFIVDNQAKEENILCEPIILEVFETKESACEVWDHKNIKI